VFTRASGFSGFINTDLIYSGFYPFSLFLESGCYIVATGLGNVATGYGHDHITQAQGQFDGLHGVDSDQLGREDSLSGKPNLRPQAGGSGVDQASGNGACRARCYRTCEPQGCDNQEDDRPVRTSTRRSGRWGRPSEQP